MNLQAFNRLFTHPNFGLLLMRICFGSALIARSMPKFLGGASSLSQAGVCVAAVGIESGHLFWGTFIAFVEFLGGMLLILGLIQRLAGLALGIAMGLTAFYHHKMGGAFLDAIVHPFALMAACLGLACTGAGKWSLDKE